MLACNTSLSTAIPTQQSQPWHSESYKDIILDKTNRLYDIIVKHFTNTIMDNAVGASYSYSSLSATFPNLSNQRDMDRMDSESFRQNKSDIAEWFNKSLR